MPKGIFKRPSTEECFWKKVNKDGPIHPIHGQCWEWTACLFKSSGYGQFCAQGFKERLSHRASWEIHFEHIPESLQVLHKCDNKLCVNPSHLFLGTHQDNMTDRNQKGRQASRNRNGSVTHPEKVPRGDRNGSRTKPECLARGDRNWSRIHPECRQGESNGNAVITEQLVLEVRLLHSTGNFSIERLAKKYGISPTQMGRIIHRVHWKHI